MRMEIQIESWPVLKCSCIFSLVLIAEQHHLDSSERATLLTRAATAPEYLASNPPEVFR